MDLSPSSLRHCSARLLTSLLEQVAEVAIEESLVRVAKQFQLASLFLQREFSVVDDGVDELHERLLCRHFLLLPVLITRQTIAVAELCKQRSKYEDARLVPAVSVNNI